MKKNIYWIDDSVTRMNYVAKNLFPKLWKKNCFCQIIIAGDDYKKDTNSIITDANIDKLSSGLSDYFEDYCADVAEEEYNGEKTAMQIWEIKKELYPDKAEHIKKTDHDEIEKEILDIIKKIENEELYIGLDIRLFDGDQELKDKTMTMRLFYNLSKKYKVFLYSTYTKEEDVIPKWEKEFRKYYKDFNGDIRIFSRDKFISDEEDKELNDFLDFFKTQNIE